MAIRKIKRTVLIAMLICAGFLSISVPVVAEASPDAREVLRRFAKKRNQFPSLIVEFEITSKWSNHTKYKKLEYRVDKNRGSLRWYMWGYVSNLYPNVSKDRPQYYSILWDGQNYYKDGCVPPGPGRVKTIRGKEITKKWEGLKLIVKNCIAVGLMRGYQGGDNGKRIDEILDGAQHIRLRKNKEKIGATDCYVIDATVRGYGKYKLWIDPIHDYHIARIHVRREEGDYVNSNRLPKNSYIDENFEVLGFQQIGGLWFPSRYKQKRRDFGERGLGKTSRIIDITNIILNPDHNALKSFIPDDIPNGAYVKIIDFPIKPHNIWRDGKFVTSAHFIWQNGKVVDKDGREVDVDKLIKAESEKVKKPKPKGK